MRHLLPLILIITLFGCGTYGESTPWDRNAERSECHDYIHNGGGECPRAEQRYGQPDELRSSNHLH